MRLKPICAALAWLGIVAGARFQLRADPPAPPAITNLSVVNSQLKLQFTPYPAAAQYKFQRAGVVGQTFVDDPTAALTGFAGLAPAFDGQGFFRLGVVPMDSNAVLTATVLNRLAYGQTPDELERVTAMGPQAFIAEQMAPEGINETIDKLPNGESPGGTNWVHVTGTGTGSASTLFIYLSSPGDAYIDDIQLVAGSVPEVGTNLIRNGGFEGTFDTNSWTVSPNLSASAPTASIAHSGSQSLHIVANAGGTTLASSIWQTTTMTLSSSKTYTLSYWYLPSANGSALTVRLSGSGIVTTPDNSLGNLYVRLASGAAAIEDLRAWYSIHAVAAKRQLLEVLTQFLDNHFVTQYSKSAAYFGNYYPDGNTQVQLATSLEFREIGRWRSQLMNPNVTFYDLLRSSAESPAMIIYLDTVTSRGDGNNVANENYARELQELFTFGVDNGYDQNDVTVMSRAWSGWTLRLVTPDNVANPFAPQTTVINPLATNNFSNITNLLGVWAFNFRSDHHNSGAKVIYPGKTVPARFGPPWAGRPYELDLPARTGTNGIADGYDVINHLANQPFTEEFISVKLCRVFVHDNFAIGYDFTDPNLSPEGQLVKQCMLAWENSSPKGQMRVVLNTIFNSDLFRGQGAAMQKVKTPFEYAASAIRVMRSAKTDWTFTADTDGYSFTTPLSRMGSMNLFDRAEPNGYPEVAAGWVSAGTLAERLRFVQTTCMPTSDSAKTDGISPGNKNVTDPVALIKLKLPAASWSDAGAVADYFLSIFFPGEGKANLDLYRSAAITYLNTADDGKTASPFNLVAGTPATLDTRVRGVAAMLLSAQRFQEQ